MRNRVIIVISSIIVVVAICAIIFSFAGKDNTSKIGYVPEDGNNTSVLQNIELVHSMNYNYKESVDYNEREWLISNEPDYMSPVLEACATILEIYYNNNLPCSFEYSSSNKYSYASKGGSVCLLTPTDNSVKQYIVEIMDDILYLYIIN